MIRDLAVLASGDGKDAVAATNGLDELKDKIWVTRKNLFVDRIACGWLIRRFVDDAAIFKYVNSESQGADSRW